jgi:hypothetical protein
MGLGVLILAGCFNPLTPEQEEGAGSAGGGVTIRVSGTPEAARTIYPRAEFSRIVLSFTPQSGQTTYPDVTLQAGGSSVVITSGLGDGNWEVGAKGYVEIDANGDGSIGSGEEFEAASSAAAVPFTVSSGSSTQVDITLSAAPLNPGKTGYFSYSVSFPAGKVDTARLSFTAPNGYGVVQDSSSNPINQKDLITDPEGTISLASGYYLVRIVLQNSYQLIGRTEIVHIYPNMETRAEYAFTAADFTEFIVLSGTVDIKIDGVRPDYAAVYAYKAEPFGGGEFLGVDSVQWDGPALSTGTWSILILSSSSPRNVFFDVSTQNSGAVFSMQWDPGVTRTVSNTGYPNIPITIDRQTLTLSGTAAVTVNGSSFGGGSNEYISVSLYDGSGNNASRIGYGSSVNSSGIWSITIEKPASSATYYIAVDAWIGNSNVSYWKRNVQPVSVSNADVSGITVTHNFTALSGTANITVNGSPLEGGASVNIYLYPNSTGDGQAIGYANVNTDGTWSMVLDETPASGTYYFGVNVYSGGQGRYQPNVGTISFPTASYTGITLTHNFSQ